MRRISGKDLPGKVRSSAGAAPKRLDPAYLFNVDDTMRVAAMFHPDD
ncbi:hypothetical protein [Rhodopirellula sp. P2]|nr:hypothetical protein [Rhodopirellula sp. P2]WDQ17819.1 hypothetical protein PSR62_04520 [Rhodopirellula sp. P2]